MKLRTDQIAADGRARANAVKTEGYPLIACPVLSAQHLMNDHLVPGGHQGAPALSWAGTAVGSLCMRGALLREPSLCEGSTCTWEEVGDYQGPAYILEEILVGFSTQQHQLLGF